MECFGILKGVIIKDLDQNKTVDYLIDNNLFEKYEPQKIMINDSRNHYDFNEKTSFQLSLSTFIIFSKIIIFQLEQQLKNDVNLILNLQDLNNKLITMGRIEYNNLNLQPTQYLLDDFYNSIIENLNSQIMHEIFCFFDKFNEKVYCLNIDKQKKYALNQYNKLYKNIPNNRIIYIPYDEIEIEIEIENDNEFENDYINYFESENKLKMFCLHKRTFQNKLLNLNCLFDYLDGDTHIFNQTFYKKNSVICNELINYEATKQIMTELNNKYKFDEIISFIVDNENNDRYVKYKHIFISFEVFQFTDNKIKGFEKDKKAHIESLWEFLRTNDLTAKSKSNFIKYLLKEHEFALGKIISYVNYDNRKDFKEPFGTHYDHDDRVKLFSKKWEEFIAPNYLKN